MIEKPLLISRVPGNTEFYYDLDDIDGLLSMLNRFFWLRDGSLLEKDG